MKAAKKKPRKFGSGGARPGSGRKEKEKTTPMRVTHAEKDLILKLRNQPVDGK